MASTQVINVILMVLKCVEFNGKEGWRRRFGAGAWYLRGKAEVAASAVEGGLLITGYYEGEAISTLPIGASGYNLEGKRGVEGEDFFLASFWRHKLEGVIAEDAANIVELTLRNGSRGVGREEDRVGLPFGIGIVSRTLKQEPCREAI